MKPTSGAKKEKVRAANLEVYLSEGDLYGRCKACGDIPRLEYLGFDPVYPHFKVICDRCGTWTSLKIHLVCHGLAWIPHRYPWDAEAAINRAAEHTRLRRAAKGSTP